MGYTEPDFSSSAVITIDMQSDTLDGQPLQVDGTSAAIPLVRLVLDAYREKQMPVIHIVRIYKKDGSNVDYCRKDAVETGAKILLENSSGVQPASGLFPKPVRLDCKALLSGRLQQVSDNEMIIYKSRWGAFYKTSLESHLRQLDVDTLVFAGCNFPNCPRTSIYQASERDFKVVALEDGISGLYTRGLHEMRSIGVTIMKAGRVKMMVQRS